MKIAVTGKGGVGKTTVAATMARILSGRGRRVYAIDADPDANLASALGMDQEQSDSITPVSEMSGLVRERTGADPGTPVPVYKMNPRVDDIPESLSSEIEGVRLLRLGTVKKGGGGCICPESALLRSLVNHLILNERDIVILDMEAGIEHLGRGTARGVDAMLVVAEPGKRSMQTAETIHRLSLDLGISRIFLIVNKVTDSDAMFCHDQEQRFPLSSPGQMQMLGCLPFSEKVRKADIDDTSPFDAAPDFVSAVAETLDKLQTLLNTA